MSVVYQNPLSSQPNGYDIMEKFRNTMELLQQAIDLFLHLDEHLGTIITTYGFLTYALLFAIIFLETGVVITPFLPGDSLLFAAGTFAGGGLLHPGLLFALLLIAAIGGDTVNYWIGHFLGPKVFQKENARFFKRAYLEKTQSFYHKYGGKTIILARFMPILRTFAPFVAGIGNMHYQTFFAYNVIGGLLWVSLFTWGGYFFGRLPIIQENFHYAIIGIIILSIIPAIIEYIKYHHEKRKAAAHATYASIKETIKEDS